MKQCTILKQRQDLVRALAWLRDYLIKCERYVLTNFEDCFILKIESTQHNLTLVAHQRSCIEHVKVILRLAPLGSKGVIQVSQLLYCLDTYQIPKKVTSDLKKFWRYFLAWNFKMCALSITCEDQHHSYLLFLGFYVGVKAYELSGQ